MLDRAVQRSAGDPGSIGVIHPNKATDDSQRDRSTKNLQRLREDRPDLHEKVLAKDMTVTETAVTAGIYPKCIAINLKSPKSAAASIRNNATPEFVAQ